MRASASPIRCCSISRYERWSKPGPNSRRWSVRRSAANWVSVMLRALLSEDRTRIVDNIQKEVAQRALPLGIEVAEVRLHRADLPFETSQAIYDRMKSERQREAKELRAQGFEWAQAIQAKADRERTVILSEAQRQSKITRGEAEAEANQLFADAFGRDPQFYKLYRSLQTYRQALASWRPLWCCPPMRSSYAILRRARGKQPAVGGHP